MAKPIDDRIAAALKPDARLADVETALSDAKAEQERVVAAKIAAEARRSDPTLGEDAALEAHLEVEESALRLIRLDRAVTMLTSAIEAKKARAADDGRKRAYDAAKARTEKLAAELVEHVAPALEMLAGYFERIIESDRDIAAINRALPDGVPELVSAEQIARGFKIKAYGVQRLTEIKLPLFDRNAPAWPTRTGRASDAKADAERRAAAETSRKQAEGDREASKARYLIGVGNCRTSYPAAVTTEGMAPVRGTIDAWCYPNQVEINRAKGLSIEPWTEAAASTVENSRSAFHEASL